MLLNTTEDKTKNTELVKVINSGLKDLERNFKNV